MTSDECISGITGRATANWIVIDYFASSSDAAGSRAWVPALLVTAGLVPSTVGVYDALWPTGWRHTLVSDQARTD